MKHVLGVAVFALTLLGGCRESSAEDGEVVRVPDEVSCQRCTIELEPVVTLAAPADTSDGYPSAVRVDSLGRFWVMRSNGLPALFSPRGEYLGNVGRIGQGPGEYGQPTDMIPFARDSVLLIDGQLRRASVLDSALNAVRSIALTMSIANPVAIRWPDSILARGHRPLEGWRGPLHRLSFATREATLLESFRPGGESMPDEMIVYYRHFIAQPRNGHFWTAWGSAYDLSHWRLDGTQSRRLERRPSWFPGITNAMSYDWRNKPPQSYMAGIEEDDDGLLWVLIATAAPTWKEVIEAIPKGVREYDPRRMDLERFRRLTIEVIDPGRVRVLARLEVDGYPLGTVPGVGFAVYRVDELAGVGQVHVYGVRLAR